MIRTSSVLQCKAVLVDSDGVLVDSLPAIRQAFLHWASDFGLDGQQVFRTLHGRRSVEVARAVMPEALAVDAASKLDRYELEYATMVKPLPGALRFLEALSGRWTVVSSGSQRLVFARLSAAGLPQPEFVVSSESVERGKPDPECYIRAAAKNGFVARECIVFEDSEAGLSAALAAGCVTIGVGRVRFGPRNLLAATVQNLQYVQPKLLHDGIAIHIRRNP